MNFLVFVTLSNLNIIIPTSIILGICVVYASYAFFKAFQQRGYKKRGYLVWLYKNDGRYVSRSFNVVLFSFFSYILFNVLFQVFLKEVASFLGLLFFLVFLIIYRKSQITIADRQKLEYTSRMKRLVVTTAVLSSIIIFGLFVLMQYLSSVFANSVFDIIMFAPITFLPLFFPFLVLLSDYVMYPIESGRRKLYMKKATEKLQGSERIATIGITGSFGKTTVKNILGVILAEKYSVYFTPQSYNTPMGISKAILSEYAGEEIFIAEMGARRKGEIKELATFIPCDFGIITAVSRQHLEGFKNLNNILDTKFELAENLKKGGVMFYNGDNSGALTLFEREQGEKVLGGLTQSENIKISELVVTGLGSELTLSIDGETRRVSTRILGMHNISNISLALEVAKKLGLTIDQMAEGIKKLYPIPHRLEIIPTENGVTVIDDSYNANVQGAKAAIEVLKLFEGEKLVVTSGFVELGNMEKYENKMLGQRLAEVATEVFIVGARLSTDIVEGLISQGFSKDRIHILSDMSEVVELLPLTVKEGWNVLFMADLPDSYLK